MPELSTAWIFRVYEEAVRMGAFDSRDALMSGIPSVVLGDLTGRGTKRPADLLLLNLQELNAIALADKPPLLTWLRNAHRLYKLQTPVFGEARAIADGSAPATNPGARTELAALMANDFNVPTLKHFVTALDPTMAEHLAWGKSRIALAKDILRLLDARDIAIDGTLLEQAHAAHARGQSADGLDGLGVLEGQMIRQRYEVQHLLGGRVLKAWDATLDRDVAVKVISSPGRRDRNELMSRVRYAAGLGAISISILDLIERDDGFFTVMELLHTANLDTHLHAEPEDARMLFRRACTATQRLHDEHHVLHSNLSPRNLLVRETGAGPIVCLVDFTPRNIGLTLRESEIVQPSRYRAPEYDGGVLTERSDVYGLGASLGEVASHLEGHLPMGDLQPVFERATADDPAERYASATALGAAIDAAWA